MAFRKLAQFREISIEYVSPTAAGVLRFYTDQPGNHLTERTGGKTLPTTNSDKTPATITFPLVDGSGAPLEGTLYYPRVEPPVSGSLQLRSGVVWMRPIGVSLDGTLGEFFECLPIPVGV
jgi:hypothetical protein